MAGQDQLGATVLPTDAGSLAHQMQTFQAASQTLTGWIAGAAALALLRGALDAGVLDAARTSVTVAQVAASTGLAEPLVADLCVALDADGVLVREDEAYHLSPDIAFLLSAESPKSLQVLVAWGRALGRTLEHLAAPEPESPAALEDTLARAEVYSFSVSPVGRAWVAAIADGHPEVRAIWEAGGRHCELGCGVAGHVVDRLALFPDLTAVGVDVDGRLLEQARRNAERLGVSKRLELRHVDARELPDEAAFDTLHWSQFFFPDDSRAATLTVIQRALRPGGYLIMPLPGRHRMHRRSCILPGG